MISNLNVHNFKSHFLRGRASVLLSWHNIWRNGRNLHEMVNTRFLWKNHVWLWKDVDWIDKAKRDYCLLEIQSLFLIKSWQKYVAWLHFSTFYVQGTMIIYIPKVSNHSFSQRKFHICFDPLLSKTNEWHQSQLYWLLIVTINKSFGRAQVFYANYA